MCNQAKRTSVGPRVTRGSAFIELSATAFMFVLAALMAVDLCVEVFGIWVLDAATRDAARAASQQASAEEALVAARSAVRAYKLSGLFSSPEVLTTAPKFEFVPFIDQDGNTQFSLGPHVRITTLMAAKLPAPIIFNGVQFTDKFTFERSYTFPITSPVATPEEVLPIEIDDSEVDDLSEEEQIFSEEE